MCVVGLFLKMNHVAADDQADLVVTQGQGQGRGIGREIGEGVTTVMTKDETIGGNDMRVSYLENSVCLAGDQVVSQGQGQGQGQGQDREQGHEKDRGIATEFSFTSVLSVVL